MAKAEAHSPKPIDAIRPEGESEAFIPYAPIGENLEHVPIAVRPDVHYYQARMGFMPNCVKLYLHVPWVAEHVIRLNNALMRDERNGLSEHFKYQLSFIASQTNECPYCVAHHVDVLSRRWDYDENDIETVLRLEAAGDEREQVAKQFVRHASLDPVGVTDEMRQDLARHYSPQEVMEILFIVGFWKMYNTIHAAAAIPLEDPVTPQPHLLGILPGVNE